MFFFTHYLAIKIKPFTQGIFTRFQSPETLKYTIKILNYTTKYNFRPNESSYALHTTQ